MNPVNIKHFLSISLFFIGIGVLVVILYLFYEKKKKEKIKARFRKFSKEYKSTHKEMRGAKRISIPESLDIEFFINSNELSTSQKGVIINLSLSGFAIIPDFPLRKLSGGEILSDIRIKTPVFEYSISRVKNIRLEHDLNKRLLGFRIVDIGDQQFKMHKMLLHHLEEFIENEDQ
jgi:hypothetical protein